MATAHINDIDLYYEEHGDANAEPVLLIMGFTMNAGAWAAQVPALSERYHVIAFDNRGAGRTTQPDGPYTMRQMAADAAGLLDHLGIASAHVIGISMGGMIAQEFAINYPERVRSLVLACTTPGGPRSAGYQQMMDSGAEALEAESLEALMTPERLQESMLLAFTPEYLASPGPAFQQMAVTTLQFPQTLEGMKGQLMAIREHDTFDRLSRITAPTLVIGGTDDMLVDAANSPILAERIPGAELHMFPGLRHGFNVEDPDEVNARILEFLAKHAMKAAA
ncbi:MAG: alpha/beta fold hydrolase [Chloroflexi bacterium]|nr:alpha/beta fold hydrolase [Chloroflexota bacterium]